MLSPKGEFFMKRAPAFLLALALILSLAACGSAGETLIAPGAADGGWTGRGGPFVLRKVELSGEALQLTGGGDAAYVLTSDGGFRLLCLEGGETRELAYTAADGLPSRIAGDESGVWLALCDARGEDYRLVHYPRDGSIPDASADIDILNCVELEYSGGEFYIYDYNAGLLRVLGADGAETAQIDLGKRTVTGLAATDGGVYVGLASEDGERTLAFCTERGLSDERQLALSVRRAGGEGCLLTDDEGLWRFSGGEPEPVAIWSECGITLADLTALVPLGEGCALINGGGLYLLEPAEPGDIMPRREVSVYSLDPAMDSTLDEVLGRINAAEPGLYAYTVHDADADAQARLRTLAELFASGEGPELVSFGGMNPVSVTGSGWFCDIYELIDADAELERSDLVAAAAYERDGRLYAIPAAFGVSTLLGRESRFGQRCGLSIPDVIDLTRHVGEGQILSRGGLAGHVFTSLAAQLSRGDELSTEELTALLSLAAEPVEDTEYLEPSAAFGEDREMLGWIYLDSARKIAETERQAGCELWPVGMPTADGSCGSLAKAWLTFGVCAAGAESGDGWALLKALLTQPDANLYGETFMYRPLFEQQLERSAVPENEAQTGTTERQRDMFAALVEQLRLAEFTSDPVKDIVSEEGAALLSGERSPEEAAALIAERTALLLSELG